MVNATKGGISKGPAIDNDCSSSSEESLQEDTQEISAENLHMQSFFERYIISDEVFAQGGQAFVSQGFDL